MAGIIYTLAVMYMLTNTYFAFSYRVKYPCMAAHRPITQGVKVQLLKVYIDLKIYLLG